MKVQFAGFGGAFDIPCYTDEKGNMYFDENNGRGKLDLYTGAWMDPDCGEICGEPGYPVTEPVECEEPFKRHPKEFSYRLLSRLKSDCKYFISRKGQCSKTSLWSDITTILSEMSRILNSFSEEEKPEWLTDAEFASLCNEVGMYV